MEEFYDKLWENTKNWKFDPFVLVICLFTLRINFLLIIINIFILIFYCISSKKYPFKYSKKFLISYVVWGIFLLILSVVISFLVIFVLGFDDAGSISYETKKFILSVLLMGISTLKILFSIFISYKSQKCKKLAYNDYENSL